MAEQQPPWKVKRVVKRPVASSTAPANPASAVRYGRPIIAGPAASKAEAPSKATAREHPAYAAPTSPPAKGQGPVPAAVLR